MIIDGMLVAEAVCCRSWPVDPLTRIGRCGLCGERTVVVGEWVDRR